jgi:hypothetical protein
MAGRLGSSASANRREEDKVEHIVGVENLASVVADLSAIAPRGKPKRTPRPRTKDVSEERRVKSAGLLLTE